MTLSSEIEFYHPVDGILRNGGIDEESAGVVGLLMVVEFFLELVFITECAKVQNLRSIVVYLNLYRMTLPQYPWYW